MIGSWYRNHEVNKRSGIFTAAGISATMFSGYIQAGVYTSLDGKLGLPGWRWLFIIGKSSATNRTIQRLINLIRFRDITPIARIWISVHTKPHHIQSPKLVDDRRGEATCS